VILNRDRNAHLRNLKTTPPIEEEATTCVECGFCEPVCPSRLLTTTPRQRIVLRREIARQPPGSALRRRLEEEFAYDGLHTCAADGTCRLACPLGIDTGALVKRLRRRHHSDRAERVALRVADRWRDVERAARSGLRIGKAIERVSGPALPRGASRVGRAAIGRELVPEWGEAMPPAGASALPATEREGAAAVYFPACVNRIFGRRRSDGRRPTLAEALVTVSSRAGMPLWIPPDVEGRCCAVPWTSKGFEAAAEHKGAELLGSLVEWSRDGELPVVIDASSCTHGALDLVAAADRVEVEVLDSIAWAERLLPHLRLEHRIGSAAVHPTCSTRHLGLDRRLVALAGALAVDVYVPPSATCCGFAGDRGFLRPELTAAATREESDELAGRDCDAYLSSNRTCEIGLERGTGRPFESFVFPLEELSR
jgi:D-lactate dehydrogenase